jgi:hypothetical protein
MGYVLSHGLCAFTYGHVLSHMGHVLSHWVTCYHIRVYSHRCSVLKAYLGRRTACLGSSAHRPCFDLSVCLHPVCLSPDSQSHCLRFFSPPHPPLVDSLDSELWYHFGCRAAALASAAPRPLGSLFGSFSPRGARSKGDQQPDGRVAHNQKLSNHPGCRYKDSRHPCLTRKEDS